MAGIYTGCSDPRPKVMLSDSIPKIDEKEKLKF
jgi:hypothetical protein